MNVGVTALPAAGQAKAARILDSIGLMNTWPGFGREFGPKIGFRLLRKS